MKRKTQKSDIIKVLKRKYLSAFEAFDLLGCTKLGTRVSDLIKEGYYIDKKQFDITTRYGAKVRIMRYKIISEPKHGK